MPPVQLTISQPCAENWAAMTPTATGRHCAACQQTVVDFTQMADAEVLAHLAKASQGNTCGRFRARQLARPLQPLVLAAPSRWRAWLAATVAVWGLREAVSVAARAQATVEQHKLGKPARTPDYLQAERKPDFEGTVISRVLQGVVLDSATHEPLPGVSVVLHGTTIGTATNVDGEFLLNIPVDILPVGPQVDFKYLGYFTEQRPISEVAAEGKRFQIQMKVDNVSVTTGVIVMMDVKPWPWHPRRFYNWTKYWVTRPFREY